MTMEGEDGADERLPAVGSTRKPYNVPMLRAYGSISALTRTVGKVGTVADGGMGSMSKTS